MKKVAAIATMAAVFAGCGSTPTTNSPLSEPTTEVTTLREVLPRQRVPASELEVLEVEMTGDGKDSRGCLVTVLNGSSREARLQYRMRWFSSEGREVRRDSLVWQEVTVSPGATGTMVSTAPAPWCVRFEIDLRESS